MADGTNSIHLLDTNTLRMWMERVGHARVLLQEGTIVAPYDILCAATERHVKDTGYVGVYVCPWCIIQVLGIRCVTGATTELIEVCTQMLSSITEELYKRDKRRHV